MRIDVIDLSRRYASVLKRELHGARCAFTVRWRRSHVVSVRGKAVSCDFAVDLRPPRFGVLQFLHYHNSCALTHHETIAVAIERLRCALGFTVADRGAFSGL